MYVFGSRWRRRRDEWMRRLCLGFTNHVGTGRVLDVCLCLSCGDVGGAGGEWVGGLEQGLDEWGWCYVFVSCEPGFFV